MSEIKKQGRPRLDLEEAMKSVEINRQKAKERYQQNAEKCREQTREYSKKQREIFQLVKELIKTDKLDEVIRDEKIKIKFRELCG
jgi:hypothetical protein